MCLQFAHVVSIGIKVNFCASHSHKKEGGNRDVFAGEVQKEEPDSQNLELRDRGGVFRNATRLAESRWLQVSSFKILAAEA